MRNGGAVGGGGVPASHTSGALGARPASPAAGDTYLATDYDLLLTCAVAGTWRVAGADRLGVTLGPFASGQSLTSTSAGVTVGPTCADGTTVAVGFWIGSVPATEQILWSRFTASSGWFIGVSQAATGYLYIYRYGTTGPGTLAKVDLAASVVTGANTLALTVAANGLALVWSLNGSAPATIIVSGTYVPPASDASHILGNYSIADVPFLDGSIAWAQSWGAGVASATLQRISTARAALIPGDPGATSSAFAFLVAAHPAGVAVGTPTGTGATPLTYTGMAAKRVQRL